MRVPTKRGDDVVLLDPEVDIIIVHLPDGDVRLSPGEYRVTLLPHDQKHARVFGAALGGAA